MTTLSPLSARTSRRIERIARYSAVLAKVGSSFDEAVKLSRPSGIFGDINREAQALARRRKIAAALRAEGLSYPKIAHALGYSAHSTIVHMLSPSPKTRERVELTTGNIPFEGAHDGETQDSDRRRQPQRDRRPGDEGERGSKAGAGHDRVLREDQAGGVAEGRILTGSV